jgi:hypothetical protein
MLAIVGVIRGVIRGGFEPFLPTVIAYPHERQPALLFPARRTFDHSVWGSVSPEDTPLLPVRFDVHPNHAWLHTRPYPSLAVSPQRSAPATAVAPTNDPYRLRRAATAPIRADVGNNRQPANRCRLRSGAEVGLSLPNGQRTSLRVS